MVLVVESGMDMFIFIPGDVQGLQICLFLIFLSNHINVPFICFIVDHASKEDV